MKKGEDGQPVVNEKEAAVVKLIYRLFLDGKTSSGICKYLENLNILSPGGSSKWSKTTVDSILTNEKYKGDALLQKKFTVDFLQKKLKPNEGEVPQYYVEGSHPAIIEPDEWDQVQAEFARRKQLGRTYSGKSVLSTKLVCADCGGYYGQKVWHSTDQYRRVIWQCNSKFDNEKKCDTPVLDTDTIQAMFIKAYNRLMQNLTQVIEDCELMRRSLTDFDALDAEITRQFEETEVVAEMVKAVVRKTLLPRSRRMSILEKIQQPE
jgi:site-specific DNA recombinase